MNTEMAGELRIRRQSLHDVVVDRLRDLIVEGVLPPEQRLNERVLSEQLGGHARRSARALRFWLRRD
jgi:DNA-binding GntR family transcriptional regulator